MTGRLKIELRQKQLYEDGDITQPIVVQCNLDGTAEYVPGLVDNEWTDYTPEVENLHDLKLSWNAQTQEFSSGGGGENVNEFGSNYSKGVSLELRFIGGAFQFIYDHLMVTPCDALNSIEARISDLDCGKEYRVFEIKLDNVKYQPTEEPCIVAMVLRERDDIWHSFQKTAIEDDWQQWFNKDNDSTKEHPTFMYIVEKKPKFFLAILSALAYIAGILSLGILVSLNDGKRWIRKMFGVCYFCPSPLVRTYIENICMKYGYTFDTIFDDVPGNPYRDVCMFYPVERGISEFSDFVADDTRFMWNNRTSLPFTKFLDQLKKVFNAEWYITPNKNLVFKARNFFDGQPPIIDFTAGVFQITDLTYTFNGKKKPAYGNYQYQIDPQDTCSNEIKSRYNAIVDYDGKANNPMLEGNVTKQFDFAATAFFKDGTSEDFLKDGIKDGRIVAELAILLGLVQLFLYSNFLTAAITAAALTAGYLITNAYINDFFDMPAINGAVRVASREINTPRLLLLDRTTPMNAAKVVYVVGPAQNPFYNTEGNDYYAQNPAYEADAGYFAAGGDVERIYNYPMYVEQRFTDNLYDRFHEYDNPMKNIEINQEWEGKAALCCEMLDILGVWEGDYARIGGVVMLENRNGRIIKGRIDHFDVDYKQGFINLKGRVLK